MYNTIKNNGDGTSIILLPFKGKVFECVFDTEDTPKLEGVMWGYCPTESLVRGTGITNRAHYNLKLTVLGLPKCSVVKNKNGNPLDCRKVNLDIRSPSAKPVVVENQKSDYQPAHAISSLLLAQKCEKLKWLLHEMTIEINLLSQTA